MASKDDNGYVVGRNLDDDYFEFDTQNKKVKIKSKKIRDDIGNVVTDLQYDADGKVLAFNESGSYTTIDMTPFLDDVYVNEAQLQDDTRLHLIFNEGSDVTVDLKDLVEQANRHADDKSDTAESNAKSYTDDKVDELDGRIDGLDLTTHTEDTSTVELSGDGTDSDPLKAKVHQSSASDNALTEKGGGLFSHVTNLSWDNEDKTLTYTDNEGDETTVDLSQFKDDIHVKDATYDPDTTTLKLKVEDGDDVTVDLKELSKSATKNTDTAHIHGSGAADDKLSVDVQVSDDDGNIIEAKSRGLYAGLPELMDAFEDKFEPVEG